MDHIRQYDWCSSEADINFVRENELDSCVTERILQNKFHDPLVSSDEEENQLKIDWSEIFKQKHNAPKEHRVYVPGNRPYLPYPKVSTLNATQHLQCLKVIATQYPAVLPNEFILRPTKFDQKVFEELKETYKKEQQEFIEWAKSLWTTDHCVRALRPKPGIETVYEAEFKMKAAEFKIFPKKFEIAAQLSFENKDGNCEMVHQKELIKVKLADLPQIQYPELMERKFSILRPCTVPEPCVKHPCKFILPNETSMTILPLAEVHRELAQYTIDSNCQYIASEKALRSLVKRDSHWSLPVSVIQGMTPDGDKTNVLVLGSDFSPHREPAMTRTYKAYRHLLDNALIPLLERARVHSDLADNGSQEDENDMCIDDASADMSSDDEDLLVIDADPEPEVAQKRILRSSTSKDETPNKSKDSRDFYSCSCKDSLFEKPPPRSFRKWLLKHNTTGDKSHLIVHCSHKARGKTGEVILEPIPEYQIDVGGSAQSDDNVRSLALALYLRKNSTLTNARVDSSTGEIITLDHYNIEEFLKIHGDIVPGLINTIRTALTQLSGLVPGHYVLHHEPCHGANALLYVPTSFGSNHELVLNFDCSLLAEADEAKSVKTAPILTPVLLPVHKLRRQLPCAFTPHAHQLAKDNKKPAAKHRTPPQAIKFADKNHAKQSQKDASSFDEN